MQARPLGHATLAADDLGDADELGLQGGIARSHLVEGGFEASDVVLAARRQAHSEVAGRGCLEGVLETGKRGIVDQCPAVLRRGSGAVRGLAVGRPSVGGLSVGRLTRSTCPCGASLLYRPTLRHACASDSVAPTYAPCMAARGGKPVHRRTDYRCTRRRTPLPVLVKHLF